MKSVQIINLSQPDVKPLLAKYCQSFFCQLRGLMFTKYLPDQQGLLLVQSTESRINSSIHMMFMWMDLAVIWINKDFLVVDTVLAKRWKIAYLPKQPAKYVLEMAVANLGDYKIGDQLNISEIG